MQIERSEDAQRSLTLVLTEDEVPVFRAAIERASFIDTPPELQGKVLDLLEELLRTVPEA